MQVFGRKDHIALKYGIMITALAVRHLKLFSIYCSGSDGRKANELTLPEHILCLL